MISPALLVDAYTGHAEWWPLRGMSSSTSTGAAARFRCWRRW
jgi:hypothetical protein